MQRTAAILVSLAGAAFCILTALGLTEALCVTEGCSVFRGAKLLGIDLYWLGAAYFLTLTALLAFQRPRGQLSWALKVALLAGLVIDSALLGVQAVTAPCVNCLVVASLLGVTAVLLLRKQPLLAKVTAIWAVLFVAALAGVFRDQLSPVPAYGSADAAIKVFFSPSCPACRLVVQDLTQQPDLQGDLALYAVAKDDGDLAGIHRFHEEMLRSGDLSKALETCFSPAGEAGPQPSWSQTLAIKAASLRNKSFLARSGASSVPFVFTSAPGLLLTAFKAQSDDSVQGGDPASRDEGCDYATGDACEEEPAPLDSLFGGAPKQSPAK
ncbi:MAG: vitamin K epoxide reductase family protein [Desulfocurvibacter africanus]